MRLRIGYELTYYFPQRTPVILVYVHDSRAADLVVRDDLVAEPHTPIARYHDSFGNHCHRILAPAGRDTVQDLPEDTLLAITFCRA